jgi:acetyl esterase
VAVKLKHYPGQFHGFITMGKILPKANDALHDIGGWLKGL